MGYKLDIMQQVECVAFNPIMVIDMFCSFITRGWFESWNLRTIQEKVNASFNVFGLVILGSASDCL